MKIALGVEYLGTDFHGWQIQENKLRTVQGVVELALSKVADHTVRVFCSGRTDSGVHAKEQVIHFETDSIRDTNAWLFGGNVNLPSDVNFTWIKEVSDDFHARFSAYARLYEYKIHNHPCSFLSKKKLQPMGTKVTQYKEDEKGLRFFAW